MENKHNCIQEKRLDRIESDLEKEAQKHEDLRRTINGKLDKIYNEMRNQDGKIITYIITLVCAFIGTLGAVFIAFMMFFK